MTSKEIVGAPLNFRGMMYAPTNEQGVVFLFAVISNDLGFKVENVRAEFPDCTALRKIGPDKYQRAKIEFEMYSRNFQEHGHEPSQCDIIVCWKHNWSTYPKADIEIISIFDEIKELEKLEEESVEESLEELESVTEEEKDISKFFLQRNIPLEIKKLFYELKEAIDRSEIAYVLNVAKTAITFRHGGTNFLYTVPQTKQIKLYLRVNPDKYNILTPLHNEYRADWPEFKLTTSNKERIGNLIPIIKDAIENIDTIFKKLVGY
ncbi:MAG: hypothetical protein ACFFCI_14450 [Promethearchaeota archaeon]